MGPGREVRPLNTLAKDHLQACLFTPFPFVLKPSHSQSPLIIRVPIYLWASGQGRAHTMPKRPLTCWGWGGDSFQTEVTRRTGPRGGSEARCTTEMARRAGQALRCHGEKHPGETERNPGIGGARGIATTWRGTCISGAAFFISPLLGSLGFFLLARHPWFLSGRCLEEDTTRAPFLFLPLLLPKMVSGYSCPFPS